MPTEELAKHASPPENAQLGQTPGSWEIDDRDLLAQLSTHMLSQCRRSVQIVSRHLDAPLYNTNEFLDALSRFIRSQRCAEVQILVHNSRPAVQQGHRLIDLQQRLSSYIQIRTLHPDQQEYVAAFLLADRTGSIYRPYGDRYMARIEYQASQHSQQLQQFFSDAWEMGEPDITLRHLHI